jgi:hypothetical protein
MIPLIRKYITIKILKKFILGYDNTMYINYRDIVIYMIFSKNIEIFYNSILYSIGSITSKKLRIEPDAIELLNNTWDTYNMPRIDIIPRV